MNDILSKNILHIRCEEQSYNSSFYAIESQLTNDKTVDGPKHVVVNKTEWKLFLEVVSFETYNVSGSCVRQHRKGFVSERSTSTMLGTPLN